MVKKTTTQIFFLIALGLSLSSAACSDTKSSPTRSIASVEDAQACEGELNLDKQIEEKLEELSKQAEKATSYLEKSEDDDGDKDDLNDYSFELQSMQQLALQSQQYLMQTIQFFEQEQRDYWSSSSTRPFLTSYDYAAHLNNVHKVNYLESRYSKPFQMDHLGADFLWNSENATTYLDQLDFGRTDLFMHNPVNFAQ